MVPYPREGQALQWTLETMDSTEPWAQGALSRSWDVNLKDGVVLVQSSFECTYRDSLEPAPGKWTLGKSTWVLRSLTGINQSFTSEKEYPYQLQ